MGPWLFCHLELLWLFWLKPRSFYGDAEPRYHLAPSPGPRRSSARRKLLQPLSALSPLSNTTEQLLSYPEPGVGAQRARTALGGASPGYPAIPVPPRARWQRSSTATAGHGRGSRDPQRCWQTELLARSTGGRCCSSAGSLPELPAHPAGSAFMGWVARRTSSALAPPAQRRFLADPRARWHRTPPGRTCCPPPPSPRPAAHTKAAARPARLSHRQHRGLPHLLYRL